MSFKNIFILIFLINFIGCYYVDSPRYTVSRKELMCPNPTVYLFNKPYNVVYNAIKNDGKYFSKYYGNILETSSPLVDTFLKCPEYDKDLVFKWYRIPSKIYFAQEDSTQLICYADYHLHFIEIDSSKTLVQIITYHSEVGIGDAPLAIIGDTPKEMTEPVEPSTIEQYEILLRIGELVGEKNMPELRLPE